MIDMYTRSKNLLLPSFKRTLKRTLSNVVESGRYQNIRKKRAPRRTGFSHVVFVCKGNLCRSPFAEHYFKAVSPDVPIMIESGGLDVDQGGSSPPFAIAAAKKHGVQLEQHIAKGLAECSLQDSDLIVLMEYEHIAKFDRQYPHYSEKAILLCDFLPWPQSLFCNIYDPYGLAMSEFEKCFLLISKAVDQMVLDVRSS